MASIATYRGIQPVTVIATAVAIARGVRVALDSDGLVAAAAISVRGDYVTLEAIPADGVGLAALLQQGSVPMVASEAVVVGDDAYSAADGKCSTTSGGGAVIVGKWVQAASGDGVLGVVELLTVL